MKKLSIADYRKVLPVLEGNTRTTTFAYAVCDQMIDGEVFINGQLTAGLIIQLTVSIIYLVIRMIKIITKSYFHI